MSFALSVQFGLDDDALPARPQVRRWAKRAYVLACEALAVKNLQLELIIRYVNEKEGRALNRQFRQKDYATNVLTFVHTGDPPSEPKARSKRSDAPRKVIADIAICAPVVAKVGPERALAVGLGREPRLDRSQVGGVRQAPRLG